MGEKLNYIYTDWGNVLCATPLLSCIILCFFWYHLLLAYWCEILYRSSIDNELLAQDELKIQQAVCEQELDESTLRVELLEKKLKVCSIILALGFYHFSTMNQFLSRTYIYLYYYLAGCKGGAPEI